MRAAGRRWGGAFVARAFPSVEVSTIGPSRCEPQRSCSFARGSSCSYEPIETCSAPWYAARSEPRSASTAGVNEIAPERSSCAAGVRLREPRTTLTTAALANSAPRTALRSNGSRAAGSARRIAGRTATASSSFAGPRSSGGVRSSVRKRLRSAATSSVPSGRRIAHAHAVGPCTSTPFASAIPPSLIFSAIVEKGSGGYASSDAAAER